MGDERLDEIEYEILDLVVDDDETTATVLDTIRRPVNAASFSAGARRLDFDGLDAVFDRLADRGLVSRTLESTDGSSLPSPGVSCTWWSMTPRGRRVWERWDRRRDGGDSH